MKIIETDRLILRPFRHGDQQAMFDSWTSDEQVAKWCRWYAHRDISDTEALLEMYLNEAENSFPYRWAITIKGEDKPVGCIDVVDMDEDKSFCEIGYVISRRLWGQGLMTETVKAVMEELFRCGFEKVTAACKTDNTGSRRVMEKSGMTFVKEGVYQEKFGSDKTIPVLYYEIKR